MSADDAPAHFLQSGPMTDLGPHASAFAGMSGVEALADLVHGILLHQHWAGAYGQTLTAERQESAQLRRARDLLDAVRELDPAPLTTARPADRRAVGVCSHFSVLAAAALRANGIPARARCGFGTYFEPQRGVDHWIVEYWRDGRWVAADFQIDALQAEHLRLDFDVLDQPEGKFLRAGEAWRACRRGEHDPQSFGIFDEGGYWFIAQNLVRDVAALNGMEMLPWDVWGPMPRPDNPMAAETMNRFDRLAELTDGVDTHLNTLRGVYRDSGLEVPAEVFNASRRRIEPVFADVAQERAAT